MLSYFLFNFVLQLCHMSSYSISQKIEMSDKSGIEIEYFSETLDIYWSILLIKKNQVCSGWLLVDLYVANKDLMKINTSKKPYPTSVTHRFLSTSSVSNPSSPPPYPPVSFVKFCYLWNFLLKADKFRVRTMLSRSLDNSKELFKL